MKKIKKVYGGVYKPSESSQRKLVVAASSITPSNAVILKDKMNKYPVMNSVQTTKNSFSPYSKMTLPLRSRRHSPYSVSRNS